MNQNLWDQNLRRGAACHSNLVYGTISPPGQIGGEQQGYQFINTHLVNQ